MSKDTKTNLEPHHGQHSDKQAGKSGILLSFILFMAWVVVIGLFISLVACQQSEPIIFVIRMGSL